MITKEELLQSLSALSDQGGEIALLIQKVEQSGVTESILIEVAELLQNQLKTAEAELALLKKIQPLARDAQDQMNAVEAATGAELNRILTQAETLQPPPPTTNPVDQILAQAQEPIQTNPPPANPVISTEEADRATSNQPGTS